MGPKKDEGKSLREEGVSAVWPKLKFNYSEMWMCHKYTKSSLEVPLNLHSFKFLSLIYFSCPCCRCIYHIITVRISNEAVSRKICDILSEQF